MELKPEDRALGQEIDREHAEELKQEERIVEALLFAMGRAVSLPEMAAALDADEVLAKAAAERLLEQYEARQGGMLIRRVETAYQLCTNPLCYEGLIRVVSNPKKPVLSDVALETLAIIAYKQPVTKAEIERIRGVQSDHAVNRLVEYGLVEESGRLNAPGRPALFVTTEEFLRRFGMESLKELPALSEDMAAEIEAQVAEEVSDVLGTDPETLQEELRSQRPELPEASAEEADNVVVPEKPVRAKAPVPRKQRETAAVRAAVEEERKEEEQQETKDQDKEEKKSVAAAPIASTVTTASVLGTAVAVAEEVAAVEVQPEVPEKSEVVTAEPAMIPTDNVEEKRETVEVPLNIMEKFAEREASDALDEMIYEAAMDTESTEEQHYSFIDEDAAPEAWDTEAPAEETEAVAETEIEEKTDLTEVDELPEMDASLAHESEMKAAEFDAEAESALEEEPATEDAPVSDDAAHESSLLETEQSAQGSRSTSNNRHHSIFDSVQVLSDEELEEIEEEERRFRESLRTLPPRQRKPEIQTPIRLSDTEAVSPAESPETADAEITEAENTEAANAGSPEN